MVVLRIISNLLEVVVTFALGLLRLLQVGNLLVLVAVNCRGNHNNSLLAGSLGLGGSILLVSLLSLGLMSRFFWRDLVRSNFATALAHRLDPLA